jgi:hypothetical protein
MSNEVFRKEVIYEASLQTCIMAMTGCYAKVEVNHHKLYTDYTAHVYSHKGIGTTRIEALENLLYILRCRADE